MDVSVFKKGASMGKLEKKFTVPDGEYTPEAVANFLLNLARQQSVDINNIKLQKLMYFSNGFYLARTRKPLLKEGFSAWSNGPVLPFFYDKVNYQFKGGRIAGSFSADDAVASSSQAATIIRTVWNRYGRHSVARLVNISHKTGSPWAHVWNGGTGYLKLIPTSRIQSYFRQLIDQGNNQPA